MGTGNLTAFAWVVRKGVPPARAIAQWIVDIPANEVYMSTF